MRTIPPVFVLVLCAFTGCQSAPSPSSTEVEQNDAIQTQAPPPQPDAEAPQPDDEAPQPDAEAPQPDAEAPQPDAEAPQPDDEAPQPDDEAPQPDDEAPQPDDEESTLVLDDTSADDSRSIDYVGRAAVRGVMQIYWRTEWSGSEYDASEKSLRMRFFLAEGQAERLPQIQCEDYDRTPSVLQFYTDRQPETGVFNFSDNDDQAAILVEDFEEIPDNFFRYREGHVEQPGTLVFRDLVSVIECDAPNTLVRLESFEPSSIDGEHRELVAQLRTQDRSSGGCASAAPFEESFMLAEEQPIYAEANLESSVVEVPSMPVVFKIRTVDDDWIEVYSYSDPDVRGFVRTEKLTPVN